MGELPSRVRALWKGGAIPWSSMELNYPNNASEWELQGLRRCTKGTSGDMGGIRIRCLRYWEKEQEEEEEEEEVSEGQASAP